MENILDIFRMTINQDTGVFSYLAVRRGRDVVVSVTTITIKICTDGLRDILSTSCQAWYKEQ